MSVEDVASLVEKLCNVALKSDPGGALGPETGVGARPSLRHDPISMEKIFNSMTLFLWEN